MRRLVPLSLLLLLVGGGLVFVLRGAGRAPPPSEPAPRGGSTPEAPAALAEGAPPDARLAPAPSPETAPAAPASAPPPPPAEAPLAQAPDDPVERGSATLVLSVTDEATGARLSGNADLWRLEAPGNMHWLPGDQRQTTLVIADGQGEATDLPEGRYRAVFHGQRGAADDPPAFEVRAPRTDVALRVPLPRKHPAWLRIVDERGFPIEEATLVAGGRGGTRITPSPAWVRARHLREPDRYLVSVHGGGWASGGRSRPVPIRAEGGRFAVGQFSEPSKTEAPRQRMRVQIEGCNEVWFTLGEGATAPTTHLGVAYPLATLLRRLTLPDGSPVLGSSAAVTAVCDAVLETDAPPADRWRTLPVHVRVTVPGYDALEVFPDASNLEPSSPAWVRTVEKPPEAPR